MASFRIPVTVQQKWKKRKTIYQEDLLKMCNNGHFSISWKSAETGRTFRNGSHVSKRVARFETHAKQVRTAGSLFRRIKSFVTIEQEVYHNNEAFDSTKQGRKRVVSLWYFQTKNDWICVRQAFVKRFETFRNVSHVWFPFCNWRNAPFDGEPSQIRVDLFNRPWPWRFTSTHWWLSQIF